MKIKTISYQRVINCGNYESKRLELFAEVQEGEDEEVAISTLMEKVERKVSEYYDLVNESKDLQRGIKVLRSQLAELESKKDKLTTIQKPEEPDNIPFEAGAHAENSGVSDGF